MANKMSISFILARGSTANPRQSFAKLPPEINQEIATYLPDLDFGSFALVERATCDAVLPIHASHWRKRFMLLYDLPIGKSAASIKESYKLRKRYLNHRIHFKQGNSGEEKACIKAIKQLILEANAARNPLLSSNINELWQFMKKSNLLHDAFRWFHVRSSPGDAIPDFGNHLLNIIRVFFFSWTIELTAEGDCPGRYPISLRHTGYGLEYSQAHVFKMIEPRGSQALVDENGEIDFVTLEHQMNLWRWHLAINRQGPLKEMFANLPWWNRPSLHLDRKLVLDAIDFGGIWKGALLIPDPASLRNVYYNDVPKTVYTDGWFTGGNDFLDLTLRGGDPRRRLKWPRVFEEATGALPDNLVGLANRMDIPQLRPVEPPLDKACRPKFTKTTTSPKSGTEAYHKPLAWRLMTDTVEQLLEANRHKGLTFPRPTTKKTRVDYKVFVGNGDATCQDNELRFAAVVHPLGSHGGIPGWKRISMVAFKKPESGSARRGYLDAKEEDFRITMTYEGVILPTGAVMLGYCRKRFEDNTYSDSIPFVYWSVCRPLEDDEDDDGDNRDSEEHAFHFQDMIARGEAEDRRDELEWAMAMEAARNRS